MAGNRNSGRRGLARQVVDRIYEMIRAGYLPGAIEAETGVHRRTVRRLRAHGHFSDQRPELTTRARCPQCGGRLVETPCRECAVARLRRFEVFVGAPILASREEIEFATVAVAVMMRRLREQQKYRTGTRRPQKAVLAA